MCNFCQKKITLEYKSTIVVDVIPGINHSHRVKRKLEHSDVLYQY